MGNCQYRRQHYITYHGYKHSLSSVAGFIRQSGDYYLFPPSEMSGGQGSERVNLLCVVSKSSILQILMEVVTFAKNHNRYIIYISFYLNSGGICTNSGTTITSDCDGWFQLVNLWLILYSHHSKSQWPLQHKDRDTQPITGCLQLWKTWKTQGFFSSGKLMEIWNTFWKFLKIRLVMFRWRNQFVWAVQWRWEEALQKSKTATDGVKSLQRKRKATQHIKALETKKAKL